MGRIMTGIIGNTPLVDTPSKKVLVKARFLRYMVLLLGIIVAILAFQDFFKSFMYL